MSTVAANKIANINKTKEVLVEDLIELKVSNLGLLASNPTTRPGGAALVIGDSYFNTISQSKITYTATGWVKSLNENDVVDNLASVSAIKALSANQGKVLADAIVTANQSITTLGNNTYTKTQVDNLIKSAAMPVGMIFPWSLSEASIPGGTIPRNGQLLSRATWPQLWALVSAQAVTDAVWLAAPYDQRGKYSSGDGSTTFRMPDDNGKHADGNTFAGVTYRGYGKNSAGTPGVHQLDQFQGSRQLTRATANTTTPGGNFSLEAIAPTGTVSTSGIVSDGVNGTPRVGSETRMTNSTVIWLTVGANGTTNSGTVDVTALASQVSTQAGQIQTLQTITATKTMQVMGAARVLNTEYTNDTGHDIEIWIKLCSSSVNTSPRLIFKIGTLELIDSQLYDNNYNSVMVEIVTEYIKVPAGSKYTASIINGSATLIQWVEYR